nr:MAG TPA: hypothetical protein [Caudoviricetes sp.]
MYILILINFKSSHILDLFYCIISISKNIVEDQFFYYFTSMYRSKPSKQVRSRFSNGSKLAA